MGQEKDALTKDMAEIDCKLKKQSDLLTRKILSIEDGNAIDLLTRIKSLSMNDALAIVVLICRQAFLSIQRQGYFHHLLDEYMSCLYYNILI